ncbi:MAG: hypothetical protein ACRD4B_10590, partial [Acidobacteriota bacterium]
LITSAVFSFFYTFFFISLFYGIFLVLQAFEFSIIAMVLFVMFLGLTSFLALRIRRSVADIQVVPTREGLISSLVTFVSLPILRFGHWLATNISQINILIFIMDLIIEAPFKLFIDVIEEWFIYVREKKEEIT